MDVLMLRLLLDGSFFLAIFNPLISGENYVLKWGLLGVLAAWMIWILVNWKKKDLEGRIQDVALSEVKILAVIQVYELTIMGFSRWQEKCAPFVIFFAVVTILFLRAGRLVGGSQEKNRFWGANCVELVILLGSAAVLSSDTVKTAAWKLLGDFYMTCIFPVIILFLNLLQLVLMFLEPLIAALFSKVEFENYEVEVDNRTAQDFLQLTGTEPLAETPLWAKIAGAVIVVTVLAIIFYFLYKKLAVAGSGRDRTIKGEVKKSALGAIDRSATKRSSLFDEKNVRYYYRKFLNHCRKKGLWPESEMVTSEMMQTIAVENWGEEASVEELTTLYREVRYGGRMDEEQDKKSAKALFKKIRASSENK